MQSQLDGSAGGNDPKGAPLFDPVGLEVVMVDRKDCRQPFAPRQMYQSRVSKIHWAILISGHQSFEIGQIRILDRQNDDNPRSKEPPDDGYVVRADEKMEDLCEDRCRSGKRKSC